VGTVHNDAPEICHRCFTRLTGLGMSIEDIAAAESLPTAPRPAERCAVPNCQCRPTVRDAVMCEPHAEQFRGRRIPISLEQFVTDPRVRPRSPLPACLVAACTRTAEAAAGEADGRRSHRIRADHRADAMGQLFRCGRRRSTVHC
jgi:hypothetical protein